MPPSGQKRSASDMLAAAVAGKSHKRRASLDNADATTLCSFCGQTAAAVAVRTTEPSRTTQPYCLLHYYTTSAVQVPVERCQVVNEAARAAQLPAIQSLFAQAFVQVQQDLSEAQARAATSSHDPLAVLHHIHKKAANSKHKAKPAAVGQGGGFWRDIPAPERLVRTQRAQARKHAALVQRMERAADVSTKRRPDLSKRRPSSRKSVWNSILEQDAGADNNDNHHPTTTAAAIEAAADLHDSAVCTACGSRRVKTLASHTARDGVRKGEVWGGANRDTSSRVQCLECGKMWNEQD